jgi:Protein of unknown function (DUF732)
MNMGKMLAALIAAALMILTPAAKADPGAICQDAQGACAANVPGYLQALAGDGISGNSDAMVNVGYRVCDHISHGTPAVNEAAAIRSVNPGLTLQQGNFAVDVAQVYLCPQVMRADGSTSLPMQ